MTLHRILGIVAICILATPAHAIDGFELARWGMGPDALKRAYPEVTPVPAGSPLQCLSSRAELPVFEAARVEIGGQAYTARFCFTGRDAKGRLRSIRLGLLDATAAAPVADALVRRYGPPYTTLGELAKYGRTLRWVADPATLVDYEYMPGQRGSMSYAAALPWPNGDLYADNKAQAAAFAAARAAARGATPKPAAGEWRFVPPSAGGGPKFGWVSPELANHFAGIALLCAEGRPPGEADAYIPVADPKGRMPVEARVRVDGGAGLSVRAVPEGGPVGYTVALPLRPGSRLLQMLGREGAVLTVETKGLPVQRYPMSGAADGVRQFMAACGF